MHNYNPFQANPADMLMAGYAAGTLSVPMHTLVSSHLALSPKNRDFVSALESVRASGIVEAEPRPLERRDEVLARILGLEADTPPATPAAMTAPHDDVFPAPLRNYLSVDAAKLPWRFLLPGVKQYRVEESERGEAMLYWIRAGRSMPSHTHEGLEATLVLRGGFTDPQGHYRRGDIAVADAEVDHHPVADSDEDCICFAVTDAPLTLTGTLARVFRKLRGH